MKHSAGFWLIFVNLLLAGCVSSNPDKYAGEDIIADQGYTQFELLDSNNNTFNSSSIEGKVTIVNFFLTNCQNACSTITSDLTQLHDKYSTNHSDNLSMLSITVDPWRDSPNDLVDYMNYFNASWPHLTTDKFTDGDFSRVEQIWSDFGIMVIVTESENSTSVAGRGHTVYYDVEHTNGIVIIGKDGLQKVRWTEDNWDLAGIESDLSIILKE